MPNLFTEKTHTMTILYTDQRNTHRIDADAKAELVRHICNRGLFGETWFDIVHIDLRGDIEAVTMFDTARGRQVIGLGGAHAWKCYERLAEEFPEINHHFRQPPSPPPPNVLFPTA